MERTLYNCILIECPVQTPLYDFMRIYVWLCLLRFVTICLPFIRVFFSRLYIFNRTALFSSTSYFTTV